jgi:hypothetical protein
MAGGKRWPEVRGGWRAWTAGGCGDARAARAGGVRAGGIVRGVLVSSTAP